MKPILEVNDIWKQYKIGGQQTSYLSLREKLLHPFRQQPIETFWALKGIDFEVNQGECIGIVGKNGAGKSTLLKILSQITPPTKGYIKARGRIASLLEVGTGFHPELTGRENIFLNGSILGLKRTEINAKFDEIVDFSGIGKFLDTPLKHYSSGMRLRLAFSVAAHLEPEILLIDEVLAVGDSEFQKKCLGKMDEVSKSGRTILFVSHNLGAVKQLCNKSILLQHGGLVALGDTLDIIQQYQTQNASAGFTSNTQRKYFLQNIYLSSNDNIVTAFQMNELIKITIHLKNKSLPDGTHLSLMLLDKYKRRISNIEHPVIKISNDNQTIVTILITQNLLFPSDYSWDITLHIPNIELVEQHRDVCPFSVIDTGSQFTKYGNQDNGIIFIPHEINFRADD